MDPRDYPPPDPYATPGSVGGSPAKARRTGRIVAIVVASVLVVAVVVGVAVAAVLSSIDNRRADAEAARTFTSSDGTFTMTLPAGWGDETEAYRANFLEENGADSTIEGLATADGLPFSLSDNFVSMSGHPNSDPALTAEDVGSADLDDWRNAFDTSTDIPVERFTTEAGDDAWMGGLRGTTDGEEWMIVVASVVGDHALARFDLEVRPKHYAAKDDLRESLASLVFSSIEVPEEHGGAFLPRNDGRTYSSEEGASMLIPASWTHIPIDADADAFRSNIDFDFLGLWQVVEGSVLNAPSVSLVVDDRAYPELGVFDAMVANYGAVGAVETDSDGVKYTVRGYGQWTAPGATDAAWVEWDADYRDSGIPGTEGIVTVRRCYELAVEDRGLMACVDADAAALDAAIAAVEPALLTVEFGT